jgi:hypothetical protein
MSRPLWLRRAILLTALSPSARRRVAKAACRLSGVLGRVRTPQRLYSWDPEHPDGPGDGLARIPGRTWLSCGWSIGLLQWSQQLDWDHWDHWATVHDERCGSVVCQECGSIACADR